MENVRRSHLFSSAPRRSQRFPDRLRRAAPTGRLIGANGSKKRTAFASPPTVPLAGGRPAWTVQRLPTTVHPCPAQRSAIPCKPIHPLALEKTRNSLVPNLVILRGHGVVLRVAPCGVATSHCGPFAWSASRRCRPHAAVPGRVCSARFPGVRRDAPRAAALPSRSGRRGTGRASLIRPALPPVPPRNRNGTIVLHAPEGTGRGQDRLR